MANSRAKQRTLAAELCIDVSCPKLDSRFTEEEALLRVWEKSGILKAFLVVLFLVLLQFNARYVKFLKAAAFNITQEFSALKNPFISLTEALLATPILSLHLWVIRSYKSPMR